MKIGLVSDTHGWINPGIFEHFKDVDEIWHAGDIGNIQTADVLAAFRPLRAVYGNIDDAIVRKTFCELLVFRAEGVTVWLTHIGGTPGHYDKKLRPCIYVDPPDLFVCGHSHIAKVMFDRKGGFLFVNPGAAGYTGFHKIMTAVRLEIKGSKIINLEMIEMGERGRII